MDISRRVDTKDICLVTEEVHARLTDGKRTRDVNLAGHLVQVVTNAEVNNRNMFVGVVYKSPDGRFYGIQDVRKDCLIPLQFPVLPSPSIQDSLEDGSFIPSEIARRMPDLDISRFIVEYQAYTQPYDRSTDEKNARNN